MRTNNFSVEHFIKKLKARILNLVKKKAGYISRNELKPQLDTK